MSLIFSMPQINNTSDQFLINIINAYKYVWGGIFITILSAFIMCSLEAHKFIFMMHPFIFVTIHVCVSLFCLISLLTLDYNKDSNLKHAIWIIFNIHTSSCMCICFLFDKDILLHSCAITFLIVSLMTYIGIKCDNQKVRSIEHLMSISLLSFTIISFVSLISPFSFLHTVSLYGGIALFSMFTINDTNTLIEKSRKTPCEKFDPITESLNVYLDILNIFIRVFEIVVSPKDNKNTKKNE